METSFIPGGRNKQLIFDGTDILYGYHIEDLDESTSVHYYGFTNKIGNWYILANDTSANTFRYVQGTLPSSYATNWTNRAMLTYDYFNNTFKEASL